MHDSESIWDVDANNELGLLDSECSCTDGDGIDEYFGELLKEEVKNSKKMRTIVLKAEKNVVPLKEGPGKENNILERNIWDILSEYDNEKRPENSDLPIDCSTIDNEVDMLIQDVKRVSLESVCKTTSPAIFYPEEEVQQEIHTKTEESDEGDFEEDIPRNIPILIRESSRNTGTRITKKKIDINSKQEKRGGTNYGARREKSETKEEKQERKALSKTIRERARIKKALKKGKVVSHSI